MSEGQMDARYRDLILAAEISGLIHDLGKLHPEFALEKMSGSLGSNQKKNDLMSRLKNAISEKLTVQFWKKAALFQKPATRIGCKRSNSMKAGRKFYGCRKIGSNQKLFKHTA